MSTDILFREGNLYFYFLNKYVEEFLRRGIFSEPWNSFVVTKNKTKRINVFSIFLTIFLIQFTTKWFLKLGKIWKSSTSVENSAIGENVLKSRKSSPNVEKFRKYGKTPQR